MIISDEAVEAAARWLYARNKEWGQPDWEDAPSNPVWRSAQDDFRQDARELLEAAAPYIAAEAWEEGRGAGFRDAYADEAEEELNPYRSQA